MALRTMQEKRRVLLVDSVGDHEGGTQTTLDELLHRADRERVSLSFVCLRDGSWPKVLQAEGFDVHIVPRTKWRDFRNVAHVVTRLKEIIRDEAIDLVHASENSTFLYASLAGKWAGVPVVWLVYDPLTGASLRRKASARLLGTLHPDWIIFGTAAAPGGVFRRHSIPTSSISPGIDLNRCRSGDGARARREFGIPEDAPVVAMFGRVEHFKSQHDCLRAIRRVSINHPAVRAVICGWENDPSYSQRVRELRAKLGLEEAVIITGYVPNSVKDDILSAADLVVHLARREPFGLAVVEAMAAGKAVVAAEAAGPASLIEDGDSGVLVPIGDVPRIATAIEHLLDDPSERTRLGTHAERVGEQHSIDQMVRKIEEVWDRVLSDRAIRAPVAGLTT